ncbi:SDR family oxidoreductase [Oleiagrimonas soli]|uniref:Dihydroflavonol-4-reductase n=1 Tax=Oleiagrimonas soli TaxID=1543381 RepID=A0A099CU59_9GAMM|nr:aldehyde reductase [Oleiagrimonas soli]KGI77329.1 epimerase [Oleiagrimonas soli]MBB6182759.1 dihydroflavonol-4-reductase [Oleiagrimonas soli]
MSRVLVTGVGGFVGMHVAQQLLAAGHEVRGSLRSMDRARTVREAISAGETNALSFVRADLERDADWAAAVEGCEVVMHVASPFPAGDPKHEDELIVPAREGALRVLRAACAAGVRRVVMTSSFAAIGYGHPPQDAPFDESDWTDVDARGVGAYIKSKALAERAAWAYMAEASGDTELTVINPTGIFGPVLDRRLSASTQIVRQMLDGSIARCPPIFFGVVDVRDVADLHVRAMLAPEAAGQRFLAVAGEPLSMADVAAMLRRRLGAAAERVPTKQAPAWLLRVLALRNARVRSMVPNLNKVRRASNERARRLLGWSPRSSEEAIVATAQSLLRLGLVDAEGDD